MIAHNALAGSASGTVTADGTGAHGAEAGSGREVAAAEEAKLDNSRKTLSVRLGEVFVSKQVQTSPSLPLASSSFPPLSPHTALPTPVQQH